MVTPLAAVRDRLEAAGIPDAAFEAAQLYMLATGRDARLSGGAPLSAFEQKKLDALCEKRCARFPLQYLCGEWDFLDLTLKVGPGVLIPGPTPRPWPRRPLKRRVKLGRAAVADLCSGTGAIALGVATHVPGARVTAVELSPDALAYLRANNAACGRPLCVVQADVLRWQEGNARRAALMSSCPTRRISRRRRWPGCSRSFSMSRAWRWRPRTGPGLLQAYRASLISARSNRAAVSFWRSAGVRRTLCVLCAFLRDMRMCLSAVI